MKDKLQLLQLTANSIDISNAPKEIKILPLGKVNSQKGDFTVDNESFQNMYKYYKERSIDIVVDYEHQTLKDVQAPAAGWIKELTLKKDGIFADVEWTPKAQEYLKNKEYRYLSPVVMVRKSDSKALILNSVALTNLPAINGMEAIVNSIKDNNIPQDPNNEDLNINVSDLKEISKALEIKEDSTKEDIIKAIDELKKQTKNNNSNDKNTDELALENSDDSEIVANKLEKFYKMKESDDIVQMALTLEIIKEDQKEWAFEQCVHNDSSFVDFIKGLFKEKTNELVMKALKDGKIAPYQRAWAENYVMKDYEGFKTFVSNAMRVVPLGAIKYLKDDTNIMSGAEDEQVTNISKMLNVSEEDLKKYNK